ncbi:MAG: inorganic diphosphatase [Patescibacteria group bacterium]
MSIANLPFGEIEKFNVVVEIPQGSQDKYEYRDDLGVMELDRVLFGAQRYPVNYGFVPETHAEDGDHTDVLLLSTNPIIVGGMVASRAVGFMDMVDNGEVDCKVIAVPVHDPRFEHIKDISDVSPHLLKEIQNFFESYKALQKKTVEIKGFSGKERAIEELEKTRAAYTK